MPQTRRALLAQCVAASLAACTGGLRAPDRGAMAPVPNPAFDAWLAGFGERAAAAGIPDRVLRPSLASAGFLPGVIERDRNQAEFTRTLEDYLAIAVSPVRLRRGRAALERHAATLRAISARHGVPPAILVAIWGLESRYGAERGDIPVVSALATLAFDGRRGAFFERQLLAALRILARGDTTPARLRGSWAGAMGHTQFIPTTYQAYAVDFTGDGRRDIWAEDPADALASAANYLARMGWQAGRPWGVEVRLPQGFDTALAGRDSPRRDWASRGVKPVTGARLPEGASALILPDGPRGPAFLVTTNFDVILRYNSSEAYGLGIGHLSDRLRGGGPIQGQFQPDANGLRLADRQELQRRLTRAGFDTQGADGLVGPNTQSAIRAYQRARGAAVTGQPSPALLARLRAGR